MISLQIGISNLTAHQFEIEPLEALTLRFGTIQSIIQLTNGHGGKCLHLDLSAEDLFPMYNQYTFGFFMQNKHGKYFSLLSLANLKINDKIICQEAYFYNDRREIRYHYEMSYQVNIYKSPPMLNTAKLESQAAVNHFQKPPVFQVKNQPNKPKSINQINGFLYANVNPDKTKQLIPSNANTIRSEDQKFLKRKDEIVKSLKNNKNNNKKVAKEQLTKNIEFNESDFLQEIRPPIMQFTNDEQKQIKGKYLNVPQVQELQLYESFDQKKQNHETKQNKFETFNRNGNNKKVRNQSPNTLSEFEIENNNKTPQFTKKQSQNHHKMERQKLKALALQQAQQKNIHQNIMIPIAKGDKFELVPLCSLKSDEIVEYVQRQKKIEQEAKLYQLNMQKIKNQQKVLDEKKRKTQLLLKKKLQIEKELSKKGSKQMKEEIKEVESDDSYKEEDDDYESDFESVSVSNSVIKSRLSSHGKNHGVSNKDSSIIDDEYSEGFESYSQSQLGKTNLKKKGNSMSDISQSYRSISQSYKKA